MKIFGAGFVNRTAGLLLCRFGENAVVQAVYASPSVVRCLAPARGESGPIDVAVSIDGGLSFGHPVNARMGQFQYVAPSVVTGIWPRSGPETGGTVITVLGSGFNGNFQFTCSLSGARGPSTDSEAETVVVPASFLSTSRLTCIAPAASSAVDLASEKNVVISVDFGDGIWTPLPTVSTDSSLATTFTYVPSVHLTALIPDHGPAMGGTVVEISGSNFHPAAAFGDAISSSVLDSVWCRFGSVATIGRRISDKAVRCSSPARGVDAPAEAEVTLSVNGGADFARGPVGAELVRAALGVQRLDGTPMMHCELEVFKQQFDRFS